MKFKFALSQENLVHGVALLTAAMGVVNVISAVIPSMRDRLRLLRLLGEYSPFTISAGGHLASALAGFALLLLSVSLWRRKQLGWLLTLSILIVSIPIHLLKGLDYEEATFAALLAGLADLFASKLSCPVRSAFSSARFANVAGCPGLYTDLWSDRFLLS